MIGLRYVDVAVDCIYNRALYGRLKCAVSRYIVKRRVFNADLNSESVVAQCWITDLIRQWIPGHWTGNRKLAAAEPTATISLGRSAHCDWQNETTNDCQRRTWVCSNALQAVAPTDCRSKFILDSLRDIQPLQLGVKKMRQAGVEILRSTDDTSCVISKRCYRSVMVSNDPANANLHDWIHQHNMRQRRERYYLQLRYQAIVVFSWSDEVSRSTMDIAETCWVDEIASTSKRDARNDLVSKAYGGPLLLSRAGPYLEQTSTESAKHGHLRSLNGWLFECAYGRSRVW